ncbi:MAG: hypothetical protein M1819_005163 [Sarea resinae]|nr:MAG: hypothetical protein M1819_005163 [Sarea resinae]
MASRFGPSALHQRDPRSALFDNYAGDRSRSSGSGSGIRAGSHSPNPRGYGLGSDFTSNGGANLAPGNGSSSAGFRPATPNKRGQYSDAVLSELESQNDEHLEGMSAKVKMLKDITVAIGDEIRDSSALAEKMNDSFDNTRVRLRGTMNRMLRMAERSGVGWKAWVAFFAAVILLFWWVWLF